MPTLTDIMEEVNKVSADLRSRVDTLDSEQKKLGENLTSKSGAMPAEYKSAIDGLNGRINELMDEVNKAKVEALRPPSLTEGEFDDDAPLPCMNLHFLRTSDIMQTLQRKAFPLKRKSHPARNAFLKAIKRKGDLAQLSHEEKQYIVSDMMPPEKKALYAGDATTGGFFASTDFVAELQAYKILISPMRQVCRVMQTNGEKVQMPALINDTSAYWATEQANFSDSNETSFGMLNIPVHEARGLMRISEQNMEDSMFDLEAFIKERLGLNFAQLESKAFVAGNGVGKPRGILSYPIKASSSYAGGSAGKNNVTDAIPYVPSGSAANLSADAVLNLLMDLKSAYAANVTWAFSRSTLNSIRLFKDSMNRAIWQPFGASNLPSTIYDRPYIEIPDAPEIAANAYPIIVGDFSHYLIVDRVNMNLRQLNELYASSGMVGFIARMRVGGDVTLPEAFRVLKVSVS